MSSGVDSPLARIVFALLVVASFGAFFVTQRLKHTPTVVQRIMMTPDFSPVSANPVHRVERVSFRIKRADYVTATVVDSAGDDVATLGRDFLLSRYTQKSLIWSGRLDTGARAPDGEYRVRIRLRNQGRTVLSTRSFVLDTTPPRPRILAIVPERGPAPAAGPPVLPLPSGGGVKIDFKLDSGSDPLGPSEPALLLYRTDVTPAQYVTQLPVAAGATSTTWDGTVGGHALPAGTYMVAIRDRDRADNVGSDPTVLPPTSAHPPAGRAGITVRYLGVQPPSVPAAAGSPIAFGIDARQQAYRWSIARVGASRPRAGGGGTTAILKLKAPNGISGAYLLGVSSGTHSEAVPFAVQGPIHRPMLVVLPTMTWLGTDAVDEDGDGLPNTLTVGLPVLRERIFSAGPPAFGAEVAPVLSWLDQHHLRYDVTTDLALAATPQAVLAGHAGVLMPGDERWITAPLADALQHYVSSGGRLASLGTQTLRGLVTVHGDELAQPTLPGDVDALGAHIGPLSAPNATHPPTITDLQDGALQLFRGGNGLFGGYASYEPVESPGTGAQIVSSAVAPGGAPVIVAAHLGSGLWVHTGLPGFASRLGSDASTQALMSRIWQVLEGH